MNINEGNVNDTTNVDTGNVLDTINPIGAVHLDDTTSICTRNLIPTRSLIDTTNIDRIPMGAEILGNTRKLVDIAYIDTKNVVTKNIFHTNIFDTKQFIDTAIDAPKHIKNVPNTSDIHKIHLKVTAESTKDIHLPSTTDFDSTVFLQVRDLNTSDLSRSNTINIAENRYGNEDTRFLFDNEVEQLLCSSASNDNSLSIQIVTEIINECMNNRFLTQALIYSITNNIGADYNAETLRNIVHTNFDDVNVKNYFDTNVECLQHKDDAKVSVTVSSDVTLDTKIMAIKETAKSFISKAVETSFNLANEVSRVIFDTEGVIIKNVETIKEPPNTKTSSEPGVNLDAKNPNIDNIDESSIKNIDFVTQNTQDTKILNVGEEIPKSTKTSSIPEVLRNTEDTKFPNKEIPTNTIDTEISMVIPKSIQNNEVLNTTVDKIIGTSKVVPDESGESNSFEWRNERIALERKINEMEQQVLMQLSRIIRILEKKDQT